MNLFLIFKKVLRRISRILNSISLGIRAWVVGITFIEPDYLFVNRLNSSSVLIDVGCGYDADFSMEMIKRYGLHSFGIDPTKKHQKGLLELSHETKNHFVPVPLAVSATDGEITFYESNENVSGSLYATHTNVRQDTITSYVVESVTLGTLMQRLQLERADYIKLDLEGAEYELIEKSDPHAFDYFDQVLIEFHHHCVEPYSLEDTKKAVKAMEQRGFVSFSFDGHNFLFYRS